MLFEGKLSGFQIIPLQWVELPFCLSAETRLCFVISFLFRYSIAQISLCSSYVEFTPSLQWVNLGLLPHLRRSSIWLLDFAFSSTPWLGSRRQILWDLYCCCWVKVQLRSYFPLLALSLFGAWKEDHVSVEPAHQPARVLEALWSIAGDTGGRGAFR